MHVCNTIMETMEEGDVVVAIGIDIRNAFNSMPWRVIREALQRKRFPDYLRRIIDSYLYNRSVEFINGNGELVVKRVTAGVPQGSVLGPILWNIGYDSILQEEPVNGCKLICYADDTLILDRAASVTAATARANLQVGLVINRIRRLGLSVAVQKTEAVLFSRKRPQQLPMLNIGGEEIQTRISMKYLGVILDDKLSFREHFSYVESKVAKVARSLGRLTTYSCN